MQTNDLLDLNPFHRLGLLLQGKAPGRSPLPGGEPLPLQLGDPRTPMPAFALKALQDKAAGWSRYPQVRAEPDFAEAIVKWLSWRFQLPAGFLDPKRHVLPLSGSREGLYFVTEMAVRRARQKGRSAPLVLQPDPGYHVYGGSAVAAGATPFFVPAYDGQPDYSGVEKSVLGQAALALICSPSNPQGKVASLSLLQSQLATARSNDFILATDECYSEFYVGEPPMSGLTAAAQSGSLDNLLVLHTLSKRSGAPGFRSAFVVGAEDLILALEGFLRFGGASVPTPIQAASAALLADETHVEANRAFYRELYDIAERVLGNAFGWRKPDGGFFAWLDVSKSRAKDGETAALWLWEQAGIRVLPGAYVSLEGKKGEANPGHHFIRIALVYEPAVMEAALTRMAEILL